MINSTIAFNRRRLNGAGIASLGSSQNGTQLSQATIAPQPDHDHGQRRGHLRRGERRAGERHRLDCRREHRRRRNQLRRRGDVRRDAGRLERHQPRWARHCNFEDNGTIGLGGTLSDQGGDTDVLTIDPLLLAKNPSSACFMPTDQRNAPRPTATCDAGAFQEGAVAPPIDSGPRRNRASSRRYDADARAAGPNPRRPRRNRRPSSASPWSSSLCGEPCSSVRGGRRSARRCAPARRSRGLDGRHERARHGRADLALAARRHRHRRREFSDGIFRVTRAAPTPSSRSPKRSRRARTGRAPPSPRSRNRADFGATERASSAPRAVTPRPPCAAPVGSPRTPARAR